jgi:hypothetical protein
MSKVPKQAVHMWLASDHIMLNLPALIDGAITSHTIAIPLSNCAIERGESGATLSRQRGWEALLRLLQSRATAPQAKIGQAADITQAQVDAFLRAAKAKAVPKAQAAKPARKQATTLSDLGDLSEAFSS